MGRGRVCGFGGDRLAFGLSISIVPSLEWAVWQVGSLIWVGIIFIVSQGVGVLLGMSPQINFEFLTGERFDLRPFWQVGAVLAVFGVLLRLLGGRRAA